MKKLIISPLGTDLASRRSAALLRANLEAVLASGCAPTVDLSHVKTISESYADELFGILALEHGLASISINGAESAVLREIAVAIRRRIGDTDLSNSLRTLIVAKKGRAALHVA